MHCMLVVLWGMNTKALCWYLGEEKKKKLY